MALLASTLRNVKRGTRGGRWADCMSSSPLPCMYVDVYPSHNYRHLTQTRCGLVHRRRKERGEPLTATLAASSCLAEADNSPWRLRPKKHRRAGGGGEAAGGSSAWRGSRRRGEGAASRPSPASTQPVRDTTSADGG